MVVDVVPLLAAGEGLGVVERDGGLARTDAGLVPGRRLVVGGQRLLREPHHRHDVLVLAVEHEGLDHRRVLFEHRHDREVVGDAGRPALVLVVVRPGVPDCHVQAGVLAGDVVDGQRLGRLVVLGETRDLIGQVLVLALGDHELAVELGDGLVERCGEVETLVCAGGAADEVEKAEGGQGQDVVTHGDRGSAGLLLISAQAG